VCAGWRAKGPALLEISQAPHGAGRVARNTGCKRTKCPLPLEAEGGTVGAAEVFLMCTDGEWDRGPRTAGCCCCRSARVQVLRPSGTPEHLGPRRVPRGDSRTGRSGRPPPLDRQVQPVRARPVARRDQPDQPDPGARGIQQRPIHRPIRPGRPRRAHLSLPASQATLKVRVFRSRPEGPEGQGSGPVPGCGRRGPSRPGWDPVLSGSHPLPSPAHARSVRPRPGCRRRHRAGRLRRRVG
jgi:hypothetical protein